MLCSDSRVGNTGWRYWWNIGLLVSYLSRIRTKPTKWHVHPAKTQISLGIRPVWSESSLSAWRKLGSLVTIERTAKTLIRLGGSGSSLGAQSLCFVMSWLISSSNSMPAAVHGVVSGFGMFAVCRHVFQPFSSNSFPDENLQQKCTCIGLSKIYIRL